MRKRQESILFIEPPDMPYIQFVRGSNVTNEFTRHVHEKLCVGVVCRGVRVIGWRGASACIPENALFAVNAGEAHACRSLTEDGHDYLALCVDMEKMKDIASQISERAETPPYIGKTLLQDGELASRTRRLFSLLERGSAALEAECLTISLLCDLMIRHADHPPAPRGVGRQCAAIRRVCEYIAAHSPEGLSLRDLSSVAALSPFHLQRLFLRETGVSPHEYQVRSRIRKGMELLRAGHSIAGAAFDAGFVDQSHFTRYFKKIVGITPGSYRQMLGKQTLVG